MTNEEEILQSLCVRWFWNTHHAERQMWHHNNNNSYNRIAGSRAKALGVVAGVLDIEWIRPSGKMLWIELKSKTGTLRKEQKAFIKKIEARGHEWTIARSLEEFQDIVNRNL